MHKDETLVRRSMRHDVSIRAAISVAGEDVRAVRFASGSGARDGWVEVDIVDLAASGVGIISPVFVPRRTRLVVRSIDSRPTVPQFEVHTVVQRVAMTDRRPAYLLGLSFNPLKPEGEAQIQAAIAMLESESGRQAASLAGPGSTASAAEGA